MTINLFDDHAWLSLRPLTWTRPVASLRLGVLTIAEKWEKHLDAKAGFITQNYLAEKFAVKEAADLYINSSFCPDKQLLDAIAQLDNGDALFAGEILVALKNKDIKPAGFNPSGIAQHRPVQYSKHFTRIVYPENVFSFNDSELRKDFALLTEGRTSATPSNTNTLIGDAFFAEENAVAECSTFNTTNGPIYLASNTEVWEGAHIRGGFALCSNSQVKMGAKIYGATTIGPYCRVGGEIKNVVIWGNTSKGHEGYLGDSVLGEWCNLGADSNSSNMKNNYGEVKLWNYEGHDYRNTGMQFCGLVMGDHTKCGINSMFNTGTVIGTGTNVYDGGYPPKFIPDFSWGGQKGLQEHRLEKMLETVSRVFDRKGTPLSVTDRAILSHVFELTRPYRNF